MKILFLTHYFPPEVNAPATRTFEHCVRWAEAGHEVTVVTCAPNCPSGVVYPGYRNTLRPQVEVVADMRVVRVWTHLAPNAGAVRRTVNYLTYMLSAVLASMWLPRPDVVIATSPQFFCGWAGVLVASMKRRPLVLEIRDIWPESIEAVGAIRARLLLRLLEKLERRMYLSARHIVTVGQGYQAKILKRADVANRISVVTNGVDLRRFEPRPRDPLFLEQWGLAGKFVCSYVGTIGMAHGLEVVLEAARVLRDKGRGDIAFCLVGDGAQRAGLEAQARTAGLNRTVVFTGRRPKEEIPRILASSDACLIHLKDCGLFGTVMPSKVFETMAMGCPIIMGVRGEARDIVMEAAAGVPMEPGSAESLIVAVERLADDPSLAMQRGWAAREFVARHYDRDALANCFLRLLEDLTGKHVSQRATTAPKAVKDALRPEPRLAVGVQSRGDN